MIVCTVTQTFSKIKCSRCAQTLLCYNETTFFLQCWHCSCCVSTGLQQSHKPVIQVHNSFCCHIWAFYSVADWETWTRTGQQKCPAAAMKLIYTTFYSGTKTTRREGEQTSIFMKTSRNNQTAFSLLHLVPHSRTVTILKSGDSCLLPWLWQCKDNPCSSDKKGALNILSDSSPLISSLEEKCGKTEKDASMKNRGGKD